MELHNREMEIKVKGNGDQGKGKWRGVECNILQCASIRGEAAMYLHGVWG